MSIIAPSRAHPLKRPPHCKGGFNKKKMNINEDVRVRQALNEIEANKYLISVEMKYNIPSEEMRVTHENLMYWQNALARLKEKGLWQG